MRSQQETTGSGVRACGLSSFVLCFLRLQTQLAQLPSVSSGPLVGRLGNVRDTFRLPAGTASHLVLSARDGLSVSSQLS